MVGTAGVGEAELFILCDCGSSTASLGATQNGILIRADGAGSGGEGRREKGHGRDFREITRSQGV